MQLRIALYDDMKAYKQLYEQLSAGLHRFSYSLVRSAEVAEEIVSDVFIKVWQMRSKLQEIDNLRVYLYTIARNLSLNYLARNADSRVIGLDTLDGSAFIDANSPADICISADLVSQMRKIIQQLPPQCRLIFQLVREEGLRYKEVAAILEISPYTVRNQMAIAIQKIGEAPLLKDILSTLGTYD
ncbi:MAG TPA: RNA polymerase sigma-70 factor [Puia sp.]|jgi:RNA polymerase sigma-70 factor (family 1)|nr:RNA polymerase sigma-70 factor [Puia sp.]